MEDHDKVLDEVSMDTASAETKPKKVKNRKLEVVPWRSKPEWDAVCELFRENKYQEVVETINNWSMRVNSLPIGVEVTLPLLEAIIYDCKVTPIFLLIGESLRSLYSLSLIRFTNLITHIGTSALVGKGGSLPMFATASHLSVPDWIIDMRHEACHGAGIPAIQPLRHAAMFMKDWLKDNYWISKEELLDQRGESVLVHNTSLEEEEKETSIKVVYIMNVLRDSLMLKLKARTAFKRASHQCRFKDTINTFSARLTNYLVTHPDLTAAEIAKEFVPKIETFQHFIRPFPDTHSQEMAFEEFYRMWYPFIAHLEKHGKLALIASKILERETPSDLEECFAFEWVQRFHYSPSVEGDIDQIVALLKSIVLKRDSAYNEILESLMKMTERSLGSERVELLKSLNNIWMKYENNDNIVPPERTTMLTLANFARLYEKRREDKGEQRDEDSSSWKLDDRGEDFWNDFPIGAPF